MTSTDSGLVAALQDLVRRHYIVEDDIDAICAAVDGEDATAEALTAALQSVNGDRHLRVRRAAHGAVTGLGSAEHLERFAAEARTNAGGIAGVARLDGGVGLLTIAPYLSPVHLAAPYVGAAFALLDGVRSLVIDVRAGRGGTPETVALICSHLLGIEPVHLQDIVTRSAAPHPFWTLPTATRLDDADVVVLTSADTFSGCEELPYDLQALGRARVVGERTRGGAHPVDLFALTDELEATIPVAKSVNAVTGTNWEQVGVVPDVACPADEALAVALTLLSA